jgi:predicted  nucleic acid-binding Zn-ribbon protein
MNQEIISKLEAIEAKIQNLVTQNFEYRQKITNFEKLLRDKTAEIDLLKHENEQLQGQLEQLKVSKAFAGNTENNQEAKQKIDSLIKEINLCITALKD